MKNIVITVNRKDYRASEIIAKLAAARRVIANPESSDFLREMSEKEVADFAPALAKEGIAEDAVIEKLDTRSLAEKRRNAARETRPKSYGSNPYRAVARMEAEEGDINHLLRSSGNAAAAE